jgi:hypothetical protein
MNIALPCAGSVRFIQYAGRVAAGMNLSVTLLSPLLR